MSKKQNDLKYLSQSILLEERGIPKLNLWIILMVFLMTTAFIGWSMMLQLDEVVTVNGQVIETGISNSDYIFKALVPSEDVGIINEGVEVTIQIPGMSTTEPLVGKIETIEENFMTSDSGDVYFEASVIPDKSSEAYRELNGQLRRGMKANIQVIVGNRTLFEYFLGNLMKTKDKALKEN